MRKLIKRPLLALVAAAALCLGVVPAEAYNPSQRAAQRPRDGVTNWVPEKVRFDHEHVMDGNMPVNTYYFGFQYDEPETRFQMDGTEQVLEINAVMPCDSDDYSPFGYNLLGIEGYDPTQWATNIPVLARPHEDTMFVDTCDDGQVSVGFGVGDVSQLTHGTWYWVTLGTFGEPGSDPTEDKAVKLLAQTGTNYDASDPSGAFGFFPQLDRSCSYSSSVNSVWNNQDYNGGDKRNKAAWCTWIDYTHRYEEPGRFTLEPNNADDWDAPHYVYSNWMGEAGKFEGASVDPRWAAYKGTANHLCPGLVGPYQESCYVSLIRSFDNLINYTYGDEAFFTGDNTNPSAELEVRCPAQEGITECSFWVMIVGWNGVDGTQTEYVASEDFIIPDDNQWYHCRVDTEHYNTNHGDTWTMDHPELELKILSDPASGGQGNLNIDNAYLGGRSKEESPANYLPGYSVSGVGHTPATPACTLGTF